MPRLSVYLLHIDPPYAKRSHYIGISSNVHKRIRRHQCGQGGKSTKRIIKAGHIISWVCIWDNVPWAFENYAKRRFRRNICPWCVGCSEYHLEKLLDDFYRELRRSYGTS